MKISRNSKIYCDANFLIAYGSKEVKQPEIKQRAKFLFAQILTTHSIGILSSLVFDECWLGIRRELGPQRVVDKFRYGLNKILRKFGLRLENYGAIEYSYAEIFGYLKRFTKEIISNPKWKIVQFKDIKNGIEKALENIKIFEIKPRDAFHLAYIQEKNIDCFITGDKRLKKKLERNPKTNFKIIGLSEKKNCQ